MKQKKWRGNKLNVHLAEHWFLQKWNIGICVVPRFQVLSAFILTCPLSWFWVFLLPTYSWGVVVHLPSQCRLLGVQHKTMSLFHLNLHSLHQQAPGLHILGTIGEIWFCCLLFCILLSIVLFLLFKLLLFCHVCVEPLPCRRKDYSLGLAFCIS